MTDLQTVREALELSLKRPDLKYEHPFIKQALEALSRLEAAAAAEYERGRQDGMKQEHAMWELARLWEEIESAAVPELSREDVVRLAREAGIHASVGITKNDRYHPNVSALGKSVPVEWLQRFASLVRSVPLTGETNAQLAVHPNHAESEQQRPMAGAVALGQPLGGSADPSAGHPAAEGAERVAVPVRAGGEWRDIPVVQEKT